MATDETTTETTTGAAKDQTLLQRARVNRMTLEDVETRLHGRASEKLDRELEVDLQLAIEELAELEQEFERLPAGDPDAELIGLTIERSRHLVDQCQLRLGEHAAERPSLRDVASGPVEAATTAVGLGPEEPGQEQGYESPSLSDPPYYP